MIDRKKIVVLGAGGHARSVIDILLETDVYEVVGCLSDGQESDVLGVPVIGTDEMLPQLYRSGISGIFVALGNNSLRVKKFRECIAIGFQPVNIVSSQAMVSDRAELGVGICVLRGAILHANSQVRDYVIMNTGAAIDHDCCVGEGCHIAGNSYLCGGVVIGEQTLIAPGAIVRDGVRIGANTVIGMGSVVTADIPSDVIAYGVPARIKEEGAER